MLSNLKFILQQRAKKWAATAFASADLHLTSRRRWRGILFQRDLLFKRAVVLSDIGVHSPNAFSGIIFSKDRPLQLDGLLNSYAHHVENKPPLTILFHASTPEYEAAYASLGKTHEKSQINFLKEKNFRTDLIALLSSIQEEKLFFLTDDDVFTHHVDFADFSEINLSECIPSLRLGLNLNYCYNARKPMSYPPFFRKGGNHLMWQWDEGTYDWAYPGSVDGNIFLRSEILIIAETSEYSAPNTFEEAIQSFSTVFSTRSGICYAQSRLVNIPANKVQSEYRSVSAAGDPVHLLKQFQNGYRLDWRKLINFSNRGVHEDIELPLVRP